MSKRTIMKVVYHFVGITISLNLLTTLVFLLFNPFHMPFAFLLIIQIVLLLYNFITYYKLYIDSVPILPFILLLMAISLIEYVFTKAVAWNAVLLLLILDILLLVSKGIKGFMFPFVKEEVTDEKGGER